MEFVYIRKLKRPDGSGLWPAYLMEHDAFGTWLFSPKGSRYRGEKDGITGVCEVGQGTRDVGLPVLHLIPPDAWWIAAWAGPWSYPWASVDICTPPTFDGGTWTYVDLELDVLSHEPGVARVDDEDEFAAACREGTITAAEAVAARTASDDVVQRMRCGREPFGHEGPQRLVQAIAAGLPPLRTLP